MLNWLKHIMGNETTQKTSLLDQEFGQSTDVQLESKEKQQVAETIAEMQKNKRDFAAFPELLGLIGNPGFAHEMRNLGKTIKDYEFSSSSSSAEPDPTETEHYEKTISVSLRGLNMIVPPSAHNREELTSTLELYLKAASHIGTGKALSDFDVTVGIYGQAVKEVVAESSFSPKPLK